MSKISKRLRRFKKVFFYELREKNSATKSASLPTTMLLHFPLFTICYAPSFFQSQSQVVVKPNFRHCNNCFTKSRRSEES